MSLEFNTFLSSAGIAILIGVAGIAASFLVKRLLQTVLARFTHETWSRFVDDLAQIVIIGVTLYLILDRAGAAGVIVIILTAGTAAFAIGSERIAGNFIAGINLLAQNYYRVGDLVTVADQSGTVSEITLSHTILRTPNRDRVIVPNAEALGNIVVNHTQIPGHYVKATVPVAGPHNREEILQALQHAADRFPLRLAKTPADSYLESVGPGTSTYAARVVIHEKDDDGDKTVGDLRLLLVDAVQAAGVDLFKK